MKMFRFYLTQFLILDTLILNINKTENLIKLYSYIFYKENGKKHQKL